MLTVTALALLIYLFGGYLDSERRQDMNHHSSRSLRRWFSSRYRRHDPWLVFNVASFTFESQRLHGFNRLASHQSSGVNSAFARGIGDKKCGKIRNFCGATLDHC